MQRWILIYCILFISCLNVQAATAIDTKSDDIARRTAFEAVLRELALELPHREGAAVAATITSPSVSISYAREDSTTHKGKHALWVERLCHDLILAGFAEERILYDEWWFRPGSGTDIHAATDKITDADKVIVVGSVLLKRLYEDELITEGNPVKAHITNLRTRIGRGKGKGIIPVYYEGKPSEVFPKSIYEHGGFSYGRFLGKEKYYEGFLDLLLDIFQDKLPRADNVIKRKRDILIQEGRYTSAAVTAHAKSKIIPFTPFISVRPIYSLPDSSIRFIDRFDSTGENYLHKIWDLLHAESAADIQGLAITSDAARSIVTGMGGIGKTQLALRYAHEAVNKRSYDFIWWIYSEKEETLLESYKKMLRKFKVEVSDTDGPEDIYDFVKENVERKKKWLLIYDNVPNPTFLQGKLPQHGGHILVTSRHKDEYEWEYPSIALGVYQEEEAIQYLLKTLKKEDNASNRGKALNIANLLGRLPLALAQAAAYMHTNSISFEEYEIELGGNISRALEYTSQDVIAATMRATLGKLSDPARKLLDIFYYLDPDRIPLEPFEKLFKRKEDFENAIRELERYALIKINGGEGYFEASLHRLVQSVGRINKEPHVTEALPVQAEKVEVLKKQFKILALLKESYFDKINEEMSSAEAAFVSNKRAYQVYQNITLFLLQLQELEAHKDRLIKNIGGVDTEEKEEDIILYPAEDMVNLKDTILCILLSNQSTELIEAEINYDQMIREHLNLSPEEYEELQGITLAYLSTSSTLQEQQEAIAILASLKEGEREVVTTLDSELTHETFTPREKIQLLNALYAQGFTISTKDAKRIKALLAGMNKHDMLSFIPYIFTVVKEIEEEELQELFVRCFGSLIIEKSPPYVNDLYKVMVMAMGGSIAKHNSYKKGVGIILRTLRSIPAEERQDIILKVGPFIREYMDVTNVASIMEITTGIPVEERDDFIKKLRPINKGSIRAIEILPMFKAMASLPKDERILLKPNCNKLILIGKDQEGINKLFKAIAEIADSEFDDIVERVTEIVKENMNKEDIASILRAVTDIPTVDRDDVIAKARPLIRDNMGGYDIASILSAVTDIPTVDRDDVIAKARPLIKDTVHGYYIASILSAVKDIPTVDRDDVMAKVRPLIKDTVHGYNIASILSAVKDIPTVV